jgi:hypothetical protein
VRDREARPRSSSAPIALISCRPKAPFLMSLIACMPVMRITALAILPVVLEVPRPS